MRIAIDAREYGTSTGRYISKLVEYLQRIDDQNDYVVLLKPQDMETCSLSNPRFSKVACPRKEFTFWDEQIAFWRQLQGLRADLVHFGKDHQPLLYRGRVVTTMHDLTTARFRNPAKARPVFKFKQLVYRWLVRRVARKSAAILAPSRFVKDDIAKFTGVDPDKIRVTYEAAEPIADTPVIVPELRGKPFIMYVGRPTPHKNLERLIEAFQGLKGQHPGLLLALAGKKDVNYRRIEASVRKRGIKNVVFLDFVGDGQLRWMYENCQAYVFPSLSEGFGLPGLEAMTQGAPVVSSNATCLPEIYGDAAHYFDPLDTTAMTDAINEVLTDQILRKKLIAAGRGQAAKYSWKRTAQQTLEVYGHLLS